MQPIPLRTTVVGSYSMPAWLEFSASNLDKFGSADVRELQEDACVVAVNDQMHAGLDVITDGEQGRFDFNLSFYGHLSGIEIEAAPPRRWGPPAHDQRGKHQVTGDLTAPKGLGAVAEYQRLRSLAPKGPVLKCSVPGPYTLSGRLLPNAQYRDRWALTEALLPIVRKELVDLVEAGCTELTVDEPSMSCYGYREDVRKFVDIFNRTVEGVYGGCRLSTHLCFGNYKGHAVGLRTYAPLFPAFLDLSVDEIHLEMASREYSELEIIRTISARRDVSVGIIDVKSYFIEPVEYLAEKIRHCLQHAPAERLSFAPDCGLSQTARWAARQKLCNMVGAVKTVRAELGTSI
jgi:5-methyltetrahydropteroyltriglutamate--homocysteine methyltransferase